jgi:tetratricopeptide (TPR) repeat protein
MQVAFIALGLLAAGQPIDKEKVRRSIALPGTTILYTGGGNVSTVGRIRPIDADADLPERIAQAEKGLRGDPGDAARYSFLSDLYYQGQMRDKGAAALKKAVALYRPQVEAHPLDGLLLTRYADCLDCRDETTWAEMEPLFRLAACLSPGEWECWVNLGAHLVQKGENLLAGGLSLGAFLPMLLEQRAREGKITPETARQAEESFAEALLCLDRAVAAAPGEPTAYLARAGFHINQALMALMRKHLRGDALGERPFDTLTDCCKDLWRAAALAPNDEQVLGVALWYELMSGISAHAGRSPTGILSALPPERRTLVQRAVARLQKMAEDKSPRAARAAELVGVAALYMGDIAKMHSYMRRALRMNPRLSQAWNFCMAFINRQEEPREHLEVLHEQLKHIDSPRNRFLLAKGHEMVNEYHKAEQVLERGLRYSPDDLMCNLGLAALLMRKDDPAALARAGKLLDRAEGPMRARPEERDAMNYAVLRIAFYALTDQLEVARWMIEHLEPQRAADERIKELAELLTQRNCPPRFFGANCIPGVAH